MNTCISTARLRTMSCERVTHWSAAIQVGPLVRVLSFPADHVRFKIHIGGPRKKSLRHRGLGCGRTMRTIFSIFYLISRGIKKVGYTGRKQPDTPRANTFGEGLPHRPHLCHFTLKLCAPLDRLPSLTPTSRVPKTPLHAICDAAAQSHVSPAEVTGRLPH